jgi:signal transduction histidine kinase
MNLPKAGIRKTTRLCFWILIVAIAVGGFLAAIEAGNGILRSHEARAKGRVDQLAARFEQPAGIATLQNPLRLSSEDFALRPFDVPIESNLSRPSTFSGLAELHGCSLRYFGADQARVAGSVCTTYIREDGATNLYVVGSIDGVQVIPHVPKRQARIFSESLKGWTRQVSSSFNAATLLSVSFLNDGKRSVNYPVVVGFDIEKRSPSGLLHLPPYVPSVPGSDAVDGARVPKSLNGYLTQDECPLKPDGPSSCTAGSAQRLHFALVVPSQALAGLTDRESLKILFQVHGPKPVDLKKPRPLIFSTATNAETPGGAFTRRKLQQALEAGESIRFFERVSAATGNDLRCESLADSTHWRPVTSQIDGSESTPGSSESDAVWSDLRLRIGDLAVKLSSVGSVSRSCVSTSIGSGRYAVALQANSEVARREVGRSALATLSYSALLLALVAITWRIIDRVLVKRLTNLSARAQEISVALRGGSASTVGFSDLRGADELGVLAGAIDDLVVDKEASIRLALRDEALIIDQQRILLVSISHEVRSPLREASAALQEGDIGLAGECISQARAAVSAIWSAGSPSEGVQSRPMFLEPHDLSGLVGKWVKNAGLFQGVRNLSFESDDAIAPVLVDPSALMDVLNNLLSNAERYRRENSIVALSSRVVGDEVEVRFYNEGKNIESDMLKSIFEYGVSDKGANREGIKGLGLFVAMMYLTKMRASIRAENLPEGVAFVLRFPKLDSPARLLEGTPSILNG